MTEKIYETPKGGIQPRLFQFAAFLWLRADHAALEGPGGYCIEAAQACKE